MLPVPTAIKRLIRRVTEPPYITYQGLTLPPRSFRYCGSVFRDDAHFVTSGQHEARRLVEHCGLTPDSSLLDVGCGPGRLAIGIQSVLGSIRHYEGIDVDARAIGWCQQYLTDPAFHFTHLDVRNERYNPRGQSELRLPFADHAFDVIYLYSVFSHLQVGDVLAYLSEFARLLRPAGRVFLTAFLEEGVPDVTENPADYRRDWRGPLHCVRYNRAYFAQLLAAYGFGVVGFDYATETDGQSAVYLMRAR